MNKVMVNGTEITIKPSRSTFTKSAFNYSEIIYKSLKRIGITDEYIDLNLPRNYIKRDEPAFIGWRVNEEEFFYECKSQERYVDNLGVISKVIAQESYAIRNGLKTFGQVMTQFRIGFEGDASKLRTPREILGIPDSIKDIDYITYVYKKKAKELHPDVQDGDAEKFKELNEAFETVKKELS